MAGSSGAGSTWPPAPARRKPDSEIAIAVANVASTVGERWSSTVFFIN
jgi:hypothetical protein